MFNYYHLTPDESQPECRPVLDPHIAMSLEKLTFTDEEITLYRSAIPLTASTTFSTSYNITRDLDLMYLFSVEEKDMDEPGLSVDLIHLQ